MLLLPHIFVTFHVIFFVTLAASHLVLSHRTHVENGRLTELENRQVPAVIGNQNFLRRAWQTSAVAGKYLYIDGGEIAFRNGDTTIYQYSSTTLSIDLSQDWLNSTVVLHTTSKPSGAPMLCLPSLWYDKGKDVFYSGITGRTSKFGDAPQPPPLSLWSFKPDGTGSGTWKDEIAAGLPTLIHLIRTVSGYVAAGGDAALVLSGRANSQTDLNITDDEILPGLIQFNMTTLEFTNSSAKGFTADGRGQLGQMHFVPSFGPQGLFLTLGGTNGTEHFGFDNIWVYEAVTRNWFNQTASGNIPEPRREFCVAGINSTEGTYEIFLYGGDNQHLGSEAVPYDEIFILTLPAFHWFKVDYPPQHPRAGHSCNAIGGSQIVSIGGFDANSKLFYGSYDDIGRSVFNSSADPFEQGLGIFDLTTLAWMDHYAANSPPYAQSETVKEFYRDHPPDGSQFSTTGLRDLFQTTHFTAASPPASNHSTVSSPTPKPDPPSSKTPAIAGGTVGGVAGLAAIIGAALYFFLRRKRQASTVDDPSSNDHATSDSATPVYPLQEAHTVQEADPEAEYKGAQLDGHGIQEMQQYPAEMADGPPNAGHHDYDGRYEMEAGQRRW